jgi:hypothetical protein
MRKILILSYHGTFGNSERQEGRGTAKDTSHNCFCLQPVSLLFCFHMLYNEGATKWQLKRKEMATMQVVVYVGNRLKDLRIEQALTQDRTQRNPAAHDHRPQVGGGTWR